MSDRQKKTAISVRGLVKRYPDGTVANRGIDLDVYEGEVLSVLGPNGAGETTLVRQITAELNRPRDPARSSCDQGPPLAASQTTRGVELLRLAVPSRRYLPGHMDDVAEAIQTHLCVTLGRNQWTKESGPTGQVQI